MVNKESAKSDILYFGSININISEHYLQTQIIKLFNHTLHLGDEFFLANLNISIFSHQTDANSFSMSGE